MTSSTPSSRDLVFQALRFEQPPRCPYYVWIHADMVPPLAAHYGADQFIGPPGGTATYAGSDTAMTEIEAQIVKDDGTSYVDEYGVTMRRGAALHAERPPLAEPTLRGYAFPDLSSDDHFAHLDDWIATNADRYRVVQLGWAFFERAWALRGMENFFMDLHAEPAFVDALLDGLEAVCTAAIDRLLRDYGDRIDAIGFTDDYGGQSSLLISPEHWRRFIKPHLARMYRKIHDGGKRVYMHTCGHVRPIVADLIEVGGDILQPIQPEAMDVFELKRAVGRDLCLMGGISTQHTLQQGSPDDIRADVRACLTRLGAGGGYIMAPAKPILPGVPLANAIAVIDAVSQQDV